MMDENRFRGTHMQTYIQTKYVGGSVYNNSVWAMSFCCLFVCLLFVFGTVLRFVPPLAYFDFSPYNLCLWWYLFSSCDNKGEKKRDDRIIVFQNYSSSCRAALNSRWWNPNRFYFEANQEWEGGYSNVGWMKCNDIINRGIKGSEEWSADRSMGVWESKSSERSFSIICTDQNHYVRSTGRCRRYGKVR